MKIQKFFRKVSWFFLSSLLSSLIGLLSIPILFTSIGGKPWAALVVAQAIGTILALIVDLGYSHFAPAQISLIADDKKYEYYMRSLKRRCTVFFPLISIIIVLELSDFLNLKISGIMVLLSYASQGLSSSWLIVSRGQSYNYFKYITLPRNIGIIVGTLLCYITKNAIAFALPLLIGNLISVSFNMPKLKFSKTRDKANKQTNSTDFQLEEKIYVNFLNSLLINSMLQIPLVLISLSFSAVIVEFSLLDKIIKSFLGLTWPIIAVMQSQDMNGKKTNERIKTSSGDVESFQLSRARVTIFVCFACSTLIPMLVPFFIRFISNSQIIFSFYQNFLIGILVAVLFFNSTISAVFLVNPMQTRWLLKLNATFFPVMVCVLTLSTVLKSLSLYLTLIFVLYLFSSLTAVRNLHKKN